MVATALAELFAGYPAAFVVLAALATAAAVLAAGSVPDHPVPEPVFQHAETPAPRHRPGADPI
jgi:hypothetical protein